MEMFVIDSNTWNHLYWYRRMSNAEGIISVELQYYDHFTVCKQMIYIEKNYRC